MAQQIITKQEAAEWRKGFVLSSVIRALAKIKGLSRADVIQQLSSDPSISEFVKRSAVSPTKTTDFAGNELVAYMALAPRAASIAVLQLGTQVDLTGVGKYSFPLAGSFTSVGWIGEADEIKVGQGVFASMPLGPSCKMALIAGLSGELQYSTGGQAATIIGHVLEIMVGRGLDAALFSNAAAVPGLSPAGLLYSASAVTGSADMAKDLGALVGKISAAGINPETVVFVAAAEQATSIKLLAGPLFNHRVIGANLAYGTTIAIAAAGLAVSGEGLPRIDVSDVAALNMSDTPEMIGSAGGVAAPTISNFQTATHALKCTARLCWAAAPGSVAVATGCTW